MAIVIPSSKTYDRQNPKVRDNVIERIEVGSISIVPDNRYNDPIATKKIAPQSWTTYSTKDNQIADDQWNNSSYQGAYSIANARTKMSRMYISGRVYIKKSDKNRVIVDLLSGVNKEGNPNINYSSRCTLKTGSISLTETLSYIIEETSSSFKLKDISITETSISNDNRYFDAEKKGVSVPDTSTFDPKDTISYTQEYSAQTGSNSVTSSTFFADERTNLSTTQIYYDELTDDYYFDYTVLCGIIFDRYGFSFRGTYIIKGTIGATQSISEDVTLTGTTEYYYPETVEITVYGNTIGIDLTDITKYIPKDNKSSKKVFSVEGNELMQTENYWLPTMEQSIDRFFNDTREKYLLGKETATIRCSISDYYEYKGTNLIDITIPFLNSDTVSKSFSISEGTYTLQVICEDYEGTIADTVDVAIYDENNNKIKSLLGATNGGSYGVPNSVNSWATFPITADEAVRIKTIKIFTNGSTGSELIGKELKLMLNNGTEVLPYEPYRGSGDKIISIDNSTGKMSFKLYDQVIPMVYGANGKDYPMSTYQDGSPKVFQVLGSKIFYDGAVWQELSLQEV